MKNVSRRRFKEGEIICVIDCWGGRTICVPTKILHVSKHERRLLCMIDDNLYRRYSSEDYGRLIFDTEEATVEAKNKLPNPGAVIYQVLDEKVCKKTVKELRSTHNHKGLADILICVEGGEEFSIETIGKTLFMNEEDAKKNKK